MLPLYMTTDTKLKTAAEKVAPALKDYTKITAAQMKKIHQDSPWQERKWLSNFELKESCQMPSRIFHELALRYNIPFITCADHRHILYSQPCLEHVFNTCTELWGTTENDSVAGRIDKLRAASEAEAKAEFKAAYIRNSKPYKPPI